MNLVLRDTNIVVRDGASIVQNERGLPWGCTVAVWVPIVLLVLLALVVVSLYRAGAYR